MRASVFWLSSVCDMMNSQTISPSKYESWGEYFDRPMTIKDMARRIIAHLDYLIFSSTRSSIVEIGTGSGAQAIVLSYYLHLVVSIDNDWEVLIRAKRENQHLHGKLILVCADTRFLPFKHNSFGLCILQGFYEHLNYKDLAQMVREQSQVSSLVVASVPSNFYPRRDYGNERLLTPNQWREILKRELPSNHLSIGVRYYHLDPEAWLYSIKASKWLGHFHEMITIKKDPQK